MGYGYGGGPGGNMMGGWGGYGGYGYGFGLVHMLIWVVVLFGAIALLAWLMRSLTGTHVQHPPQAHDARQGWTSLKSVTPAARSTATNTSKRRRI